MAALDVDSRAASPSGIAGVRGSAAEKRVLAALTDAGYEAVAKPRITATRLGGIPMKVDLALRVPGLEAGTLRTPSGEYNVTGSVKSQDGESSIEQKIHAEVLDMAVHADETGCVPVLFLCCKNLRPSLVRLVHGICAANAVGVIHEGEITAERVAEVAREIGRQRRGLQERSSRVRELAESYSPAEIAQAYRNGLIAAEALTTVIPGQHRTIQA